MKNAATLLSSVFLAVIACTSAAPPAPPAPPPDLSIGYVHVAGSADENTWTVQNPIPLRLGCANNPIIVGVSPIPDVTSTINGFQIAVPGGCSDTDSCGWFVLRVDPGTPDEIVIPTWKSPITVDDVMEPGTHVISIELHDAYDRILLQGDSRPFGEQVSLEFAAPDDCPQNAGDAG
jgi:hypothetical protein